MTEYEFEISIEVAGPFISKSSNVGLYGVDSVALVDANQHPIVPKGRIKGLIREQLLLAKVDPGRIARWLGPSVNLDSDSENVVGSESNAFAQWTFTDFVSNAPVSKRTLTRIHLEDDVVAKGALQVIQSAIEPGQTAEFTGRVTVEVERDGDKDHAILSLAKSIRMIPFFGSFRGVGFGRQVNSQIQLITVREYSGSSPTIPSNSCIKSNDVEIKNVVVKQPLATSADQRNLYLSFEDPFCLGEKRKSSNIFRSLEHVPGAVIKGAIARKLALILGKKGNLEETGVDSPDFSNLCKSFSQVRFCGAFAAKASSTSRPSPAPMSLVKGISETDEVRDATSINQPFLLKGDNGTNQPEFCPEWKSGPIGWPLLPETPRKELRLQTSIDRNTRRARDEHLFGKELVHPVNKDNEKLHWIGAVTISGMDDDLAEKIWAELEALFAISVFQVGKTKSRTRISMDAGGSADRSQTKGGSWVLVLQSPALILDLVSLEQEWKAGQDSSSDCYATAFDQLSKQSLQLDCRYASESLQGGYFVKRNSSNGYAPLLVTDAGSVFVLSAAPGQQKNAQACIDDWVKFGLPQPDWVTQSLGTSYQTNPMLRSDGFGEVLVNAKEQINLQLKPNEVEIL